MTRIVLDQGELAAAAAGMTDAAGEYQAIGARVAACDCGCMPPDVAAVVDSAASAIRSRLTALSTDLAAGGGELAWRSGISQDGGGIMTAASSASGPGVADNVLTIGGLSTDAGVDSSGGMRLVIGSSFDSSIVGGNSVGGTMVVGGTDHLANFFAANSTASTITIGSGDTLADFFGANGTGGSALVIGGSPLPTSLYDGPTMADAMMALGYSIQSRQQAISNQLANMPPVYASGNDPIISGMITSQLLKNLSDSQRRLDVVSSPNYHSSSYFANRSDYLDQYPSDIRPW